MVLYMNMDQLKYFVLISNLGSINKVSQQLFVSPQAISSAIKKLEDELGCSLFIRDGKKSLILSEQGKIFITTAEDILHTLKIGLDRVHSLQTKTSTKKAITEKLNIQISTVHSISIIPSVIEIFSHQYPQITLTLIQQETPEIIESVSHGDTLGVYVSFDPPAYADDILCQPLTTDKLYAVIVPTHPLAKKKSISIKTILKYPLVILQSGNKYHNPLCSILEKYGDPSYYTITNNYHVYQDAIKKGLAIGFFTYSALKNNTALPQIRDQILTLPIRDLPNIITYSAVKADYYAQHEDSIKNFLTPFQALQ